MCLELDQVYCSLTSHVMSPFTQVLQRHRFMGKTCNAIWHCFSYQHFFCTERHITVSIIANNLNCWVEEMMVWVQTQMLHLVFLSTNTHTQVAFYKSCVILREDGCMLLFGTRQVHFDVISNGMALNDNCASLKWNIKLKSPLRKQWSKPPAHPVNWDKSKITKQ